LVVGAWWISTVLEWVWWPGVGWYFAILMPLAPDLIRRGVVAAVRGLRRFACLVVCGWLLPPVRVLLSELG